MALFGGIQITSPQDAGTRKHGVNQNVQDASDVEIARSWSYALKRAGQDYDKIMACGEPPEYFDNANPEAWSIYESVSQWPAKAEALRSELLGPDILAALKAFDSYLDTRFPWEPSIEMVFGEGVGTKRLQAELDALFARLADEIRTSEGDDALRLFERYAWDLTSNRLRSDGKANYPHGFGLVVAFPLDWNNLVAQVVRYPSTEQFSPC